MPLSNPSVHGLQHGFLPGNSSVGPDDFMPRTSGVTGSEAVGVRSEKNGKAGSDGLAGGFRYCANRTKMV